MVRIRVTPEQVRNVASQFGTASSQSDDMVNKLRSTVESLNAEWEGMTQQKFYGEFQQWQSSMKNFVTLLNEIKQQLEAIATRFETADKG